MLCELQLSSETVVYIYMYIYMYIPYVLYVHVYTCMWSHMHLHVIMTMYVQCMTCAPVLCKLLACLSKHDLYWCYNQAEMHGLQWWITIIHALYSCSSHLPTHTHTYVLTLSHLTLMFMCTKWVVSPHFLTHSHT